MGGVDSSTAIEVTELYTENDTSSYLIDNQENTEDIWRLVFCVLLTIATCITVAGNLTVIGAFITDKRIIQKPANLFILNLSISDMIIGAIVMPVYLCSKLLPLDLLFPSWVAFCRWWQLMTLFGLVSSFHFVLMVAYDRYQLVKDPFSYVTHRTFQKILKETVLSWVTCVIAMSMYFVAIYFEVSEQEDSCGVLHPTVLHHPILRYITVIEPVSLTSFLVGLNIGIIFHLYHRTKELAVYSYNDGNSSELVDQSSANSLTSPSLSKREMLDFTLTTERKDLNPNVSDTNVSTVGKNEVSSRVEENSKAIAVTSCLRGSKSFANRWPRIALLRKSRKAIHKMFLLVTVYEVCFLPWFVAVMLDSFSFEVSLQVIELTNIAMWLNSMVNPFLYATTNVRLRRGMRQLMRCGK